MNFATLKETIRKAVRDASGLPCASVVFEDRNAAGVWRSRPCADIRWLSVRTLGADYRVQSDAVSTKMLSLSVKIEDDALTSVGHAIRMQTRLRFPHVRAALLAEQIAIVDVSKITSANYKGEDSRIIDASVVDLMLATVDVDSDEASLASYSWIERVIASGLLSAPDRTHAVSVDVDVTP